MIFQGRIHTGKFQLDQIKKGSHHWLCLVYVIYMANCARWLHHYYKTKFVSWMNNALWKISITRVGWWIMVASGYVMLPMSMEMNRRSSWFYQFHVKCFESSYMFWGWSDLSVYWLMLLLKCTNTFTELSLHCSILFPANKVRIEVVEVLPRNIVWTDKTLVRKWKEEGGHLNILQPQQRL